MDPSKTYCTFDLHTLEILKVFTDKKKAEKFTIKRMNLWYSIIAKELAAVKVLRFETLTLDEAIEMTKERIRDKYSSDF